MQTGSARSIAAISINPNRWSLAWPSASVGSINAALAPMDARLLLVSAPILLAVGWAVFNIGRAAVGQLQLLIKRSRA